MRRPIQLITTAMAFILSATLSRAATFSAKVVSVVDGDTFNISENGARTKVILYGVDCPEMGQDYGEQARQFTDQCIWHKTVTMEDRGKDSLGRTVAVVFLPDGTNLNEELVRRGLAWWSDKYAPEDVKLKQLHASAQAARIGLWSAPNPIPPWIWRNGQKQVHATIKPGR